MSWCDIYSYWRCPNCGKRTYNTGGYHYAEEISNDAAMAGAISAWNNRNLVKE